MGEVTWLSKPLVTRLPFELVKKLKSMRYAASKEAVRACLDNPGYVVFKVVVVKKELLNEVKDKLVSINIKSYVEARRIIENTGLPNPDEVLARLGFYGRMDGVGHK